MKRRMRIRMRKRKRGASCSLIRDKACFLQSKAIGIMVGLLLTEEFKRTVAATLTLQDCANQTGTRLRSRNTTHRRFENSLVFKDDRSSRIN